VSRRDAIVLVIAGLVLGAAWTVRAGEPPPVPRAFEVHYRPLADAAELIDPLLSADGTVTLRPRLSALVVQDRPAVLERVAALLQSWDVPPRSVEITFSLFLGTDQREVRRDAGPELTREVRGVLDTLSDFTKWNSYEPLGSRSVSGTEGDRVVVNLSDEYRVTFVIQSVHETLGTTKFDRLQLQSVQRGKDGEETVRDLYTMGAVVPPGELYVVGAAMDPNSKRALFLTLQTRAR
jgi:hypothetical protein